MSRSTTPSPAETVLAALRSGREPDGAAAARARGQALMRQTMAGMGLTPRDDPGAGLPPAQADMARRVARMGR